MLDWLKRLLGWLRRLLGHKPDSVYDYIRKAEAHVYGTLAEIGIQPQDARVVLMFTKAGRTELLPKMRSIFRGAPQLVRFKDYAGETLLHYAVEAGWFFDPDPEQILFTQELLAGGADIDARDERGITPLMNAVNASYPEIVELLLNRGADVRGKTNNGTAPIHFTNGKRRIVEMLLRHGADINARRNDGATVLSLYLFNHVADEFVAFLTAQGASV